MRERLTLAVLALALVLMTVIGLVRGYAERAELERAAVLELAGRAQVVATVLEERRESDRPVTSAYVERLLPERTMAEVVPGDQPGFEATSPGFEADSADDFVAREQVGQTEVRLVQSHTVVSDRLMQTWGSLAALLLVMVVLSAFLALLVGVWVSRPFARLSRSAAALARGRTDLDLPASRVPEVASISASLRLSARQLEESIARDRDFFQHASHVLRTPLTGLRLELEDLSLRDDVDADVRRTATRCVADVARLDAVVGELLGYSRGKSLMAGAETTLLDLGSRAAQTWRDTIPEDRELKTFVDGDPEVALTPGPVEQLLEQVLEDVVVSTTGAVTLRFAGETEHVRISVVCDGSGPAGRPRPPGLAAQGLAEVLGGRYDGDLTAPSGLSILLPRR